jgi:hypothetical protein
MQVPGQQSYGAATTFGTEPNPVALVIGVLGIVGILWIYDQFFLKGRFSKSVMRGLKL